MKPSNDREAITLILTGLVEKGVELDSVWDGEELTPVYPNLINEAVEAVTACDEASVNLILPGGKETFVYFALGNDPEEVVCDCGVSASPFIDPIVDPWWE